MCGMSPWNTFSDAEMATCMRTRIPLASLRMLRVLSQVDSRLLSSSRVLSTGIGQVSARTADTCEEDDLIHVPCCLLV